MQPTKIGAVMPDDVVAAQYGTPFKDVVRLLREHRISGSWSSHGVGIGLGEPVPQQALKIRIPRHSQARRRRSWTGAPALLAGPVLRTSGRRRGGLCPLRVPRMVTLDQELAARDRADTAEEPEQRGPGPAE
ncbi:CBS domain-containing protein [Streptomyces mirabilis]|uniref:hypothetical protein n=1 Tax=Streptomyces mirabilis TaxID=68239 RepID=UPI003651139F